MKTSFTTFMAIAALVLFSFSVTGQNQLNGVINYHNNPAKPIEDVDVELFDDLNNLIAVASTNQDGQYSFNGLSDGTYTIIPSADFQIAGDGMQDAFLVLMHIIGFNPLTGLQFAAGDVNEDATINMTDYVMILVDWLAGGNPPPGDAWEFESFTVTLAKDSVFSSGGTSDVDVDGSWTPGVKPGQSVYALYNQATEKAAKTELEIPLQINADVPVAGLSLVLEFPSQFLTVSSVTSPLGEINYTIDGDIIRMTWMDVKSKNNYEPVIKINATTSNYFVGENTISFNVLEKSHLIDPKGHLIENVEIEMPEFTAEKSSFNSGDIYPNPTSGLLNISYELEKSGSLKMEIYGMNGQLVATHLVNNQFPGFYKETIDVNDLGLNPGIYSIRIAHNGSENISTKKLLVTK